MTSTVTNQWYIAASNAAWTATNGYPWGYGVTNNSTNVTLTGTFIGNGSGLTNISVAVKAETEHDGNWITFPPPIILSSDIGSDVGDESMAALLCVGHMMGLIKLEALTSCVRPGTSVNYPASGNISYVAGAGYLEQLAGYYGIVPEFGYGNRTNLGYTYTFTRPYASGAYPGDTQTYGVLTNSSIALKSATNYSASWQVMRRVLASRRGVEIITTGQFYDLADLLSSPADSISPLTGVQLVSNSVNRVVSMAGKYPYGKEYNMDTDPDSVTYCITNMPASVPIVWVGFELGNNIFDLQQSWLTNMDVLNPAHMLFTNTTPVGGRASWDSIAALYAVMNVRTNAWFNRVQGSNNFVPFWQGNTNYWVPGTTAGFKDFYLTVDTNNYGTVSMLLNSLITKTPEYTGAIDGSQIAAGTVRSNAFDVGTWLLATQQVAQIAGITSFQGRTNAAAALTVADLTGFGVVTNSQSGVTLSGAFSGNGIGITNVLIANVTTPGQIITNGNSPAVTFSNLLTLHKALKYAPASGFAITSSNNAGVLEFSDSESPGVPFMKLSSSGMNVTGGTITGNGSGLTNLNATNLVGKVQTASIGYNGTPNSSTFLRGDNVWSVPSGGSATNVIESAAGNGISISTNSLLYTISVASGVTNAWQTYANSVTNGYPWGSSGGSSNLVYCSIHGGMTNDTAWNQLNADSPTAFGSDQTTKMQALLDRAKSANSGIHVIIDGRYTVGGLVVYSNTWVEAMPGCGLMLATSNNMPLFRNANFTTNAPEDENITISGGVYNFNGYKQSHDIAAHDGYIGGWVCGMEFIGVNNLTIKDTYLHNASTIMVRIQNCYDVAVRNTEIDAGSFPPINRDGWHFNGPCGNITMENLKIDAGDDGIAFNANEPVINGPGVAVTNWTPLFWAGGPITNVTVRNVNYIGSCLSATRLLSSGSLIDNVSYDGLHGTVTVRFASIDNYQESPTNMVPIGNANLGSIRFANIDVELIGGGQNHQGTFDVSNAGITNLVIDGWYRNSYPSNYNWPGGLIVGLNIAQSTTIYDTLSLKNWSMAAPYYWGQAQASIGGSVGTLQVINNTFQGPTNNSATVVSPIWIRSMSSITNMVASGNVAPGWTNAIQFDGQPQNWAKVYGDGSKLVNLPSHFDFTTNLFSGTSFLLGTNYTLRTATNVYFTAVGNVPVNTERWGQLTIIPTSNITITNPVSWYTSDGLSSRVGTNGMPVVFAVDVQPGLFTNVAIVHLRQP